MVGSATFTIVTSIMSISAPVIMTAAASQSPEDPDLVLIAVLPLVEQCSITNTVLTWSCVPVKRCSLTGTMFETGQEAPGKRRRGGVGRAAGGTPAAVAATARAGATAAPGPDQPRGDRGGRDPAAGRRGPRRAQHAADRRRAGHRRGVAVLARRQQGRPA